MTSPEERYSSLRRFATEIRLNTLETLNHLGFGHYGVVYQLLRLWLFCMVILWI